LAPPESLELRAGEEETIRLPGRGTVGYAWTVHVSGESDAVVSVRQVDSRPEPGRPPGESVDDVFVLSAQAPGRARVHFEQRRPWEPDGEALATHDLDVVVG
jgi:predicted secreted protein